LKKTTLHYRLTFFFVASCFLGVNAQYTNVINSNKPGFSESPYSVGTGIYQFESNLFYRDMSIEPTFSEPQSLGIDLLFRTSFFLEKLEFSTHLSYQRDQIAFNNVFTSSEFTSGLSNATIGAKYLVFQQEFTDKSKEVRSWKRRNAFDKKRLIPSVAVYAGFNTNFLGDLHKTSNVSPKLGVLLQNDLSNDFNVITNFYYDKMGTDASEFSYIITATYSFSDRWSTFFENQGVFKKERKDTNIGTGIAYLLTTNLQVNASARGMFEGNSKGYFTSLGVSYRINRHRDSYIELDDNGNPIEESPEDEFNKKKKNFFGRIFSIFKKKDSSEKGTEVKTKKKKKRRGFFGLFKKKKETELKKIEREIKELEKKIKKDGN
tara:strand:- start:4784 stop:5914 length:1131 start_codon:yes stop_codon:yes gene_type:complete